MSEKRLNNTIFLYYLITEGYKVERDLTTDQFLELDDQYDIIKYISECPDIFDPMTKEEMVEEIDHEVAAV